MTVNEKKTFRLYKVLNIIALGFCIYLAVFVSPLKDFFLPHLRKFVTVNIDAFVNVLWVTFIAGSVALVLMTRWIASADRINKSRAKSYLSKLVAKDYYKGAKRIDFYKAVKTSLSKYSRQVPGEEDPGTAGADVVTSDAFKIRGKLKDVQADDVRAEPAEDTSDGTHKYYFPNGTLKREITYQNGKVEGIYRTFYEDGSLHQERHFKNGLLHGVFKAYDEFGIPYFEMTYKDGVKHGIESGFYKSGVVEYQDVYEEGVRVSRATFDEGGELKFKHSSET